MTLRTAIYVRLSRDHEAQTSIERQEADCRKRAAAEGWEVTGTYADVGISGYKSVTRPEYERLRADLRSGRIDIVLIWKLDRLTRGGIASMGRFLEDLTTGSARLIAVMDGVDTATPSGELLVSILASVAKAESENTSIRIRSAKDFAAAKGLPHGGGRRPYGYADGNFTAIVEDEAAVIRAAAEHVIAGGSVASAARLMNDLGATTPTGGQWLSAATGRLLRQPHLAGLRTHHNERVQGTWTGILTLEEHEALLGARGDFRPAKVPAHLLTGVLRCGLCGGRMRCKTTQRFGRQYTCGEPSCGRLAQKADTLEEVIDGMIAERLERAEVRSALTDRRATLDAATAAAEVESIRERLAQLARDHYVDQAITRHEFQAAREGLDRALLEAEGLLARANAAGDALPEPEQAWREGDLAARREIVGRLIERLDIAPTTVRGRSRFDPERVSVRWKV